MSAAKVKMPDGTWEYIAVGATGDGTSTPDATTSIKGKVELATSAEGLVGTSTTLVPPVATVQAMIDDSTTVGAVTSVNGQDGVVQLVLSNLYDIDRTPDVVNQNGVVITPGALDDYAPVYEAATGKFKVKAIPFPDYDGVYAPAGYLPPWYVPIKVLGAGETIDTVAPEFPADGLVFDENLLGGTGEVVPTDLGFITWTQDPAMADATLTLDTGRLRVAWLPIRADVTISYIYFSVTTAAAGTASAGAALYDVAAGTRLGFGNTITDAAGTASNMESTGLKKVALTTPVDRVLGGNVWAAVWFNGTTAPLLRRGGSSSTGIHAHATSTAFTRFGQTAASTATTATPPTPVGTITKDAATWFALA